VTTSPAVSVPGDDQEPLAVDVERVLSMPASAKSPKLRRSRAMTETRTIAPNEDPVCGMTVNVEQARPNGLALTHEGREYVFCGKGCLLEFRDDPAKDLDPAYRPQM
jgi:YHS domain-containing protein